jgi:hypothetical protein
LRQAVAVERGLRLLAPAELLAPASLKRLLDDVTQAARGCRLARLPPTDSPKAGAGRGMVEDTVRRKKKRRRKVCIVVEEVEGPAG